VPRVLTDERSFGRVLFHLLDNAFKFSPPESTVRVRFRREENDLAIAIEDRGVGIPEDKRARIFEAFYQVDNSLTRAHEGLGIGLALTKMLLTALAGSITVQSEEGLGSTFTVYLPIAPEDSPPLA
jgi:signal transduction histidine kinase